MDIKQVELEAYYCVSTVLVVVFGMQAGGFEGGSDSTLYNTLDSGNFLVSAVENMIDLVKHHSHNFKEGNEGHNKNVAKKFSKYFQRIYQSLAYYFKKENTSFPFATELNLCNQIVKVRGKTFDMIDKINDEKESFTKYMETFGLGEKLTYKKDWIKNILKKLVGDDIQKFKDFLLAANGWDQTEINVWLKVKKADLLPVPGGGRKNKRKKRSRKKNRRRKHKRTKRKKNVK
jgi:hypothetical protein